MISTLFLFVAISAVPSADSDTPSESIPKAHDVSGQQASGDDILATYKVSGSVSLRPEAISDDGIHTYISWSQSQLIPAVFGLDPLGREEMVDGYMREGIFTIDRVYPRLLFRIDKSVAAARRQIFKGSSRGQ